MPELDDPVGTAYGGDALPPVYSWQKTAYHAKTIVQILTAEYQPENLCFATPIDVSHNVSFLIDNTKVPNGDVQCDDMGSWVQNGTHTNLVVIERKSNDRVTKVTLQSKQSAKIGGNALLLRRRYYVNASDKEVPKIISTIEGMA